MTTRPPLVGQSWTLPLAFLASGAAGLLFEVLWFRALGRVLGNTVWAGALVLTAFMLGIALGGWLAARWAQRIRRPARAFAAAEITVAVSGSLLIWGLPITESLIGDWLGPLAEHSTTLACIRLLLALAVMLIPTTAMGTTLALGVRLMPQRETASALGILYAANTFGACLAPVLAEFHLIGALGLRGTALVAMILNLLAASLVVLQPQASPAAPRPADRIYPAPGRLLLAAAGAGALALALEVVWFRLLILHAPATDEGFALMLTLLLAGIAAGGALAPPLGRLHCAWIAAFGGIAVVLGYVLASPQGSAISEVLAYAVPLMLPAAILSGCLFTLLGAELRAESDNPQPAIGKLTCANTLGGALGAALAGFILMPRLGIEWSLFLLAAGYALLALLLVEQRSAWRGLRPGALAAAALLLFPFGRMDAHLAQAARPYLELDGATVVEVTQGPTTTLQILRRDLYGEPAGWRLLTDSYSMSAIGRDALRYMQLFAWLPQGLHPEPKRALLISYGAGNTARALLDDPALEQLTVVDVSPEILAASPVIHGQQDPLQDPRVRLVLEDGRHYLRLARERFDLITGEPPPPMLAGVVNLYTREYFAAMAARLAPGGLATYWLPVQQFDPSGARATIAAFCSAFPDCTLWAGSRYDWILLGGREFRHRPGVEQLTRLWREQAAGSRIVASGLEYPVQLGATFIADAAQLRGWYDGTPAVTDDYPKRLAARSADVSEYVPWLEPDAARRRFETSNWIATHWPADLARQTLPYFTVQAVLNGHALITPPQRMPLVDGLLRNTDLRVPILWLLGSDVPEQEILDRRLAEAGPQGGYRPEYARPLGIRALAERDYKKAAELLDEAAKVNPRQSGALAAYALCRAGQRQRAAAVPNADWLVPQLRCWNAP